MDIQRISGADAIPEGFSENSEIKNKSENTEKHPDQDKPDIPEENKGNIVDTLA